jgi:hypothetical protein
MNVWDSNDVLIKETQFMTDIPVHANKLTTIIGEVVVQFTMNVWDSNDVLIKETQFMTDIPVHANKLTTIIGEVLTEGGNVKITIDNGLAEQERVTVVSSASHLLKVINAGGEYIMGNNVIVTAKDVAEAQGIITRAAGEPKTTTINLNGYTITLKADVEVEENTTLIIDNQPLYENGGDKGAVINDNGAIVNNGTLVIEGGNYNEGAIQNNGTTNVNGGDFANDAINNNGNVTIEGDNSGKSDDIVKNDEEATLNKVVYNAEELQAALDAKNADEIIFGADIKGEATISQTEGVNIKIDGKGKKFDGTLYIHGNSRHTGEETLTIQNINFVDEAEKDAGVPGAAEAVSVRFRTSFESRYIQSGVLQDYYTAIKNLLLSYKGVKARTSWNHESFNKGRQQCAKINIKGNALLVYLALDPANYNVKKYHFNDMSSKPKFDGTPMLMKVKSERALKYTLELIAEMMNVLEIPAGKAVSVDYHAPFETTEALAARGLVKIILPAGATLGENLTAFKANVGAILEAEKSE